MRVTDPVCGMQIDPAKAAGKSEYGGVTYWFCCQSCLRKFEADPAKYARPGAAGPEPPHRG